MIAWLERYFGIGKRDAPFDRHWMRWVRGKRIPADREALVVAIGQASDPPLTYEACERLADALLARGLRLPGGAPGHTDLMVTPESLDAWLDDNPPPHPEGNE